VCAGQDLGAGGQVGVARAAGQGVLECDGVQRFVDVRSQGDAVRAGGVGGDCGEEVGRVGGTARARDGPGEQGSELVVVANANSRFPAVSSRVTSPSASYSVVAMWPPGTAALTSRPFASR